MKTLILMLALSLAACGGSDTDSDCTIQAQTVQTMARFGAGPEPTTMVVPRTTTVYLKVCDGGYRVAECYVTAAEVTGGEPELFGGFYCQAEYAP